MPSTSKRSYAIESKPASQPKKEIEIIEPKLAKKPQSKQQQSHTQIKDESQQPTSLRMKDSAAVKSEANINNLLEQQELQSVTESSRKQSLNEKSEGEGDGEGDEELVDRKTGSRATSKGAHDPDKIWTTAEILADEDLWHVTDSSEESTE